MDEQTQIKDLRGIIRRGRKSFAIISLTIFVLGLVIAFALPPIYCSKSTILIENQQIPEEYVRSAITGYVEERLQMITQQIMSRTKLVEVIKDFDLYPEMKDSYTTEEIVKEMTDDIKLDTISAEVVNAKTGQQTVATIAFTLSYEGKVPNVVQKVANALASLYLEQNLKTRGQQASDTTVFLQQEGDQLKAQIDEIQEKVSEFKQKNPGALPEFTNVNLQNLARFESDIGQADMQLRSLQERLIYLKGQLAGVDPLNPVITEEGKAIMNPKERLKYLRMQLVSQQSSLSEKHPDIIRLKNEIKQLEAQTGDADDSVEKARRLNDLQGQLATLEGKLGPKHPDVIKTKNEIELLSRQIKETKSGDTISSISEKQPDNPAYINLMTQIASAEMDIKTYTQQKAELKQKIDDYMEKIEKSPQLEKEYNDMIRDLDNARMKYSEVMNKLMEARIAQGMEESNRGERFTIIDPAQLPEKPFKPNRLAIILIGFVLALGAGVGIAAFQETMDTSIKTVEKVMEITGVPVFSTISFIETDEELRAKKRKKIIWLASSVGAIILALIIIHNFVMPLDIAWIKVQRRLMIL
jgi:polysaccharide biosynthesis transport protein